jgi:diguanylate cyclase (GGDEF)-like protein/PAS domain S-box-containing protein
MLIAIRKTEEYSRWLRRCAWAVLALGLLLSVLAWWRASSELQRRADERFARETADVSSQLTQLVDHYIDVLRSFQAMFLVSEAVPRSTFHRHYVDLDIGSEYPAMLAVQFARHVRQDQKADFEAAVRADHSLDPKGYPDFRIRPPGSRPDYVVVLYNEPMAPNQAAFGYDTAYEPTRQTALERARDSGLPQLSAPLPLVQAHHALGVLMTLPVYQPGARLDTIEARRQAFVGVVSGVIRASNMVGQIVRDKDWQHLQWRILDAGTGQASEDVPAQLLYSTADQIAGAYRAASQPDAADVRDQTFDIGGRHWQLHFVRAPVHATTHPYPLALLLGGMMASLGLWWALRSTANGYAKASALAQALSAKALASERHLRSVLDSTIDGLMTLSSDGRILSINHAACLMFGYRESDLTGQHLSILMPAAASMQQGLSLDEVMQIQRVGIDGVGRRAEGRRSNGMRFPMDLAMSTMFEHDEVLYIAVMRDLSAQDASERAVVEAQRQLNEVDEMRRVIVHNAPYAIFVLNAHGIIQTVNPAGEKLLGFKSHELVGRSTTQRFFDPDQVADRSRLLALRLNQPVQELDVLTHLAKESPGLPSEWTLRRRDGSFIAAEITVTELNNEHGLLTGYLAMAYDVTSRREAEHQLQHLAQHDALTALPNRNMLQDQLKICLSLAERQGHHMALMFLDVDRFKKINDGLGHHIGDAVLIEIARRLRTAMRTTDIVARLGGDEFVILLPQISALEDGERVAQKVLDLFSDPLRIDQHELRITPSIGLALYPEHGSDTVTLMRHADLAMYQAKNNGRNRVQVYSDQMHAPTAATLVLENDLYKALERDELRLHFQPQFDCASGRITGAEALLRWEHDGRLVPPSEFIPLAEETGLIVPMGEWVLRRACHMAQRWRDMSQWPLRVAVNLSAVQLDNQNIPDLVAQVLRETGLPATALELEITESVVVRESLRAADLLSQLRTQGVGIAIDDFGVGYSSFAYLRELPVDRFKLDRSFLTSVPESTGDSRLVAALIAMGHRLDVGIVAEGVETQEQAAFLVSHGCDEAQGFYLGRPIAEEAFEAMLMAHARLQDEIVRQALRPVSIAGTACDSTFEPAPSTTY